MTKTYTITIDIPAARAFIGKPELLIDKKDEILALNDDAFVQKVFEIIININQFEFATVTEVA